MPMFHRALVACIADGRPPSPQELRDMTQRVWQDAYRAIGGDSDCQRAEAVARLALSGTAGWGPATAARTIHLITGAKLIRDIRPVTVSYGGLSETVQQPGWWPLGDGEAVYDAGDLKVYSDAWTRLAVEAHRA
jgi:hypothetical protein